MEQKRKQTKKEEMSLKTENDRNRQAKGKLRYLHTDVELYEFLIELQEELVQKNQRKKELEEIGCFGAEQYSKIAEMGQTFFDYSESCRVDRSYSKT